MTGQDYRVIADRDNGDNPSWHDVAPEDRYTSIKSDGPYPDPLMRIERPVPIADARSQMERDSDALDELRRTPVPVEHPSLPTREQIAEAIAAELRTGNETAHSVQATRRVQGITDAVFALLQKGADR
ncbi:MAG: hypothetical protein K0Q46_2535 [Rhodococcus erythropolis]|jgi:hypothetical protein|nr:hypothetical protein [Rhodococcus erythropolis]MDF2895749.1 hypothetical protein [Rhodococcus erythropolis]